MNISIPEAIKELEVGKTKLYGLFKQLNITPSKKGNKSFLTLQQVSLIKDFLKDSEQFGQSAQKEQTETSEKEDTKNDFYQKRIKQLEAELNEGREENKSLIREVGLWQGRAKTLEEQNVKLLELTPPETAKEDIEEAEIIEAEPPKSKGWFSFFRKN